MAKYSVKIENYTDIDLVSNTLANILNVAPQVISKKIKYFPCMFGSTESYENAKIIADAIIETGGKATVVISPDLSKSDKEITIQENSQNKESVTPPKAHIKQCLSCGAFIGTENYACTHCGGTMFKSYEDYADSQNNSAYSGHQNEVVPKAKTEREYTAVRPKSKQGKNNNSKSSIISGIVIFILLSFLLKSCSGPSYVAGDHKCDICGKPATKSIGSEEYCSKHYKDAEKWYIDKAAKKLID